MSRKKNSEERKLFNNDIFKQISLFLALITLMFFPTLQDPFNVTKLIFLYIFAGWALFWNLDSFKYVFGKKSFKFYLPMFCFITFYFIASLNTENFYTAFIGEEQRKNGFLSYFCVIVISTFIIQHFQRTFLFSTITTIRFVALLSGFYGLLQSNGIDFVKWNNPYNAIISTMGNPNFSSALFAIFATILFVNLLNRNSVWRTITDLLIILLLQYGIINSQSKQGILSFIAGAGIGLSLLLLKHSKKMGISVLSLYLITIILVVLGMLNRGPIQSLIYKESVSIRGYYWRAGVKMFIDHPILGVGIDSYGSFFREYREGSYPLKYGYQITSTNAHSVPIQLMSTGGIFVFLSYLMIIGLTFYSMFWIFRNINGVALKKYIAIFSGYISYIAQSFISIDQIALMVWGWVFSSLIVGGFIWEKSKLLIAQVPSVNVDKHLNYKKLRKDLVGYLGVGLILIPSYFLYLSDNQTWIARNMFSSLTDSIKNNDYVNQTNFQIEKAKKIFLQSPSNEFLLARFQLNLNKPEGLETVLNLLAKDKRNLDFLNVLAIYYEDNNDLNKAVEYRKKVLIYDPYNAENFYYLGRIYKKLGNFKEMQTMLNKINALTGGSKLSQLANRELIE